MRRAIGRDRAGVGDSSIHGVALLKTEEAPTRRNGGKQVGCTQREAIQAERIGSVGLLRRYDATAGPLVAPLFTAEHHVDNFAVAVQDGGHISKPRPPFCSSRTARSWARSVL